MGYDVFWSLKDTMQYLVLVCIIDIRSTGLPQRSIIEKIRARLS